MAIYWLLLEIAIALPTTVDWYLWSLRLQVLLTVVLLPPLFVATILIVDYGSSVVFWIPIGLAFLLVGLVLEMVARRVRPLAAVMAFFMMSGCCVIFFNSDETIDWSDMWGVTRAGQCERFVSETAGMRVTVFEKTASSSPYWRDRTLFLESTTDGGDSWHQFEYYDDHDPALDACGQIRRQGDGSIRIEVGWRTWISTDGGRSWHPHYE